MADEVGSGVAGGWAVDGGRLLTWLDDHSRVKSRARNWRPNGGRVHLFVFFRIPSFAGNEISAEISPNFANSERKENSNLNLKNEISVNSDRNFGDFDRNSVIFHGK